LADRLLGIDCTEAEMTSGVAASQTLLRCEFGDIAKEDGNGDRYLFCVTCSKRSSRHALSETSGSDGYESTILFLAAFQASVHSWQHSRWIHPHIRDDTVWSTNFSISVHANYANINRGRAAMHVEREKRQMCKPQESQLSSVA
jgi:hypothetical protein